MAASSGRGRSGASRAFTMVLLAVLLLAAGLTAAWYYVAGEIDRRVAGAIEAAAGEGVAIGCEGRRVFGYPFRIGVGCDTVAVDAPERGFRAAAGSLRTAAQIYRPGRIVAELDAPLTLATPGLPPLDLRWDLAQASTSLWTDGLERFSLAVDAPVVSLRQPAEDRLVVARAERFELHARQNAGDLDLALSDRSLRVSLPGLPELPPFDLAGDVSVAGATDWLRSGVPGGGLDAALRGRSGTIRSVRIVSEGSGSAELSGPFTVSEAGEISGDFRLAVRNPQGIATLVGSLVPGAAGIAGSIAAGIGFAAREEDGQSVIDVAVRDGEARIGFIPLGRLPAL